MGEVHYERLQRVPIVPDRDDAACGEPRSLPRTTGARGSTLRRDETCPHTIRRANNTHIDINNTANEHLKTPGMAGALDARHLAM